MRKYTFKNLVITSPADVVPGDAFAIKVVAVAGFANDWSAYRGPSHWSDDKVAREGDKLYRDQAEPLFHAMRSSGRHYRL